jgi:hypothetical protein
VSSPGRRAELFVRALSAARIGLGSAIVAATDPALGALGFEQRGPLTRALGRLAGSRDVALGALALAATDPAALRRAALAGVACDASDAIVLGIAAAERGRLERATAGGMALALIAVAAGSWAVAALGGD